VYVQSQQEEEPKLHAVLPSGQVRVHTLATHVNG
jgi:hypothetical protein